MAKKSTDAEIEQRVSTVYRLMLRGSSRESILQYAAKKEWGVETRSVDGYIARAKNLLRKQAETDRTDELGKARARLNLLFGKALKTGDLRTALAVQKELNQLADLYPVPPTSLKAFLTDGGAPVDLAFWSALFQGLKAAGIPALAVFKDMLDELEKAEANGGT